MTVSRHGIASFEPTSDSVLIWTRLSGVTSAYWVMSTDPQMAQVVARGRIETGPDRDYTAVVDVTDLRPATTYWYRVEARCPWRSPCLRFPRRRWGEPGSPVYGGF